MTEPRPAARWRLFTALLPSPGAVQHLDRALEPVRAQAQHRPGSAAIRWLPHDLWHLTLVFLGGVEPGRTDQVRSACAAAAAESLSFDWRLRSAGAFPSAAAARVLWIGVEADEQRLRRLFRAVRREVRAVRVPVERRPYAAHLTVARVRRSQDAPAPRIDVVVHALQGYEGPAQRAQELALVRSHPGRRTVYETLESWPLSALSRERPGTDDSGRQREP